MFAFDVSVCVCVCESLLKYWYWCVNCIGIYIFVSAVRANTCSNFTILTHQTKTNESKGDLPISR